MGARLPANAGEDSVSFLPALLGAKLDKPLREATVHHGGNGKLAIRKGHWVFIDAKTGDANKEPDWFKRERGYRRTISPASFMISAGTFPSGETCTASGPRWCGS